LLLFIKLLLFILRRNFSFDTDLCVGLIVQPLFGTIILSRETKTSENVVYSSSFYLALALILCGVSVLTTTTISADRLFALLLGLRYRHVVTLRRVRVVIICLWFIGTSLGCGVIISIVIALKAASALVLFCFIISIFCHSTIFFKLRHQQAQIQNHASQGQAIPLNIARYNKSVSSILCVQLGLVACYVPWGINVVLYLNGKGNDVSSLVTQTLTLINSSLNPIMYCWKIRAVRAAVKDTIRQINCFL